MSEQYTVHFVQVASANPVRIEATDPEAAIEAAWDALPGSLCHHCAAKVDLAGEWQVESVVDSKGETVLQEKLFI